MMDSHKWVLLGACMATLSGCGGSDDNKSTTATSVAPVFHVATTLKAGIALPQPGVYQTTLLTRDDPHQTLVNFAGLAIVYPQRDAQLRWDIWADDGAVATWWLGQAGMRSDSTEPSTLTLTRISRNKVADSAVLTRDNSGAQLVPSNYQRQSSVPSQVMIKTMPVIKAEGERVRYSAFDLSSTGTTVYHNWNGQVGITAVNTTNIKSEGTVAKLAMRQPFVLFKGLTFQKLCLPGAFRPGDHHNKMLRPGLCVVHASPQYL